MLNLTDLEKRMLDGDEGDAARVAMQILVRLGETYGAGEMIPIASAHVVGSSYQIAGEAGIEIYQRLVRQGAKVRVRTTCDPASIDFERWTEFRIPDDYAGKQKRVASLLADMGVIPTYTCTPYYVLNPPLFGEHVAWAESSAVNYVNSIIGARTNRLSAYVDLAAAIAGRVPKFGLHVRENRRGDVVFSIDQALQRNFKDVYYPAIGYYIGSVCGTHIPVIDGLPRTGLDNYKMMCASMAASGSTSMFHIPGVTPEAATLTEALKPGVKPERYVIDEALVRRVMEEVMSTGTGKVDIVGLGCPHASVEQIARYADFLQNKKVMAGTELWICTNRVVFGMAVAMGYADILAQAGARLMVDTCLNDAPLSAWGFKHLVTDSGKFAYYVPTSLGATCTFTDSDSCLRAAVEGRIGG